ncbi:MAG: hypothetical protein JWM95_598 [Gemmatimonadetes bacterium]|nr:hypothetical protein [Gemmatimonadota bacterium]
MLFPRNTSPFTYTLGFSLLALAFGGVVLAAHEHPDFGSVGSRWKVALPRIFAFLGVYSYTIYLAHSVIPNSPGYLLALRMVHHLAGNSIWVERAFFLLASIVGGVLLSHIVERPALQWRSRLFPSPMSSAGDTAAGRALA